MFPLIAIAAFFILGIAFFIFGKDDFGITRVKEVSKDTNLEVNRDKNLDPVSKNDSSEENRELVNAETSSEINSGSNESV
tara:strand:- start:357 stop:596 length:240 start_codon:yes stop_codon:yes gene_type:complete